jgi:hypothetical protein
MDDVRTLSKNGRHPDDIHDHRGIRGFCMGVIELRRPFLDNVRMLPMPKLARFVDST